MTTTSDIITRWTNFRRQLCQLGGIRPSTFANQDAIGRILSAGLGHYDIHELRRSHIELWARGRLIDCKPVTVHAELNVLRQILTWAVEERILTEKPRMPTVPVPNVESALPGDDAYLWYLRNLPAHIGSALNFMMLTGLAPHELARLRVEDHRPDTSEIAIGHRATFLVKQPSRRRTIPLNQWANTIWTEATLGLAADAHPFPKEGTMQRAMRRLFLSRRDAPADCAGLTPKMMRKWFASKIAAEHSEALLQRLLGHAPGSPVTRRHYVRSQEDQARGAVGGLGL